jgi:hypothetical protein
MENITIPEFEEILIDDVNETVTSDSNNNDNDDNGNTDEPIAEDVIMEEKQDIVKDTTDNNPNYGENADAAAVAIFEELINKGVLDEQDRENFDGTWEKVEESLTTLPQRVLNGLVQQAPDLTKDVLRFAFTSPNITRDDLVTFLNTYIEETKPIDVKLSTMDDARDFLYNIYEERGLKPRAINAALNSLEDEGDLLDEAKQEYEKLAQEKSKTPKSEQLIADKENEELQKSQERIKFAEKISEELEATGWKASKINEIKNNFSNVNQVLQDIYKNPKSLIKLVDFLSYYNNGDIDYSKFINSVETPKAKEFKQRFQEIVNSPTLSTKSNFKTNSKLDDAIPVI